MEDEVQLSLKKFSQALARLKEGVKAYKDDLTQDGVIQRFEFTFELGWKTLKRFLSEKGIEAVSPKDIFKESFRLGWVKNERFFLNMLKDRNQTSHIYSKDVADQIVGRIKNDYVEEFERLLKFLEKLKV